MSREGVPVGRRWREGGGDPVDDRIGDMIRQVPDAGPLPAGRLERSGVALAGGRLRRSRRLPALRWVVVAALVLGSGGAVFARHGIARLLASVTGRVAVAPAPVPARTPGRRAMTPAPSVIATMPEEVAAAPETVVAAPVPAEGPAAPAAAPAVPAAGPALAKGQAPEARPAPVTAVRAESEKVPGPRPRARVARPQPDAPARPTAAEPVPVGRLEPAPNDTLAPIPLPTPAPIAAPPLGLPAGRPAAPLPPGLGDEARLVRRALEELRHDRDPTAALASLDEHRARFRGGLLRADAELVRVEALLALDREGEALALLEGLDLAVSPRRDEFQITRGELRARRDCTAALADFDRALGESLSPTLAERALRGRAVCLLRLGDPQPADRALREYLQRFPQGRFAAEARKRLQTR